MTSYFDPLTPPPLLIVFTDSDMLECFALIFSNVNAFCNHILEMQKWDLKFNALHVALDGVISNVT